MDEDLVFTKRFLDCVKKPHPERTEQVSGCGVSGAFKQACSTESELYPSLILGGVRFSGLPLWWVLQSGLTCCESTPPWSCACWAERWPHFRGRLVLSSILWKEVVTLIFRFRGPTLLPLVQGISSDLQPW